MNEKIILKIRFKFFNIALQLTNYRRNEIDRKSRIINAIDSMKPEDPLTQVALHFIESIHSQFLLRKHQISLFLLAHLSMYPSPSPSHAWNSFRTRSSSQMEPVSLSASAVCDIFSLELELGRHRYSRRSVAAAVARLAPHLLPIARRIACRILIRARAEGSMSPTRVYLATRDDACRTRDEYRGMVATASIARKCANRQRATRSLRNAAGKITRCLFRADFCHKKNRLNYNYSRKRNERKIFIVFSQWCHSMFIALRKEKVTPIKFLTDKLSIAVTK